MPKLYKDDLVIETNLPSEIVTLKSQGFSTTKPEPESTKAPAVEAAKPAQKSTK